MLLLGRRALAQRADGALSLRGAFFETDYADFVAWRAFGHPGERVDNCFSMAALRSAEGAFLLGEMSPHTMNGGQIYFPAGTPDPNDVFDGKVDLDASARRELLEETGVVAEDAVDAPGWTVVFAAAAHRLHEADDAPCRPRTRPKSGSTPFSRSIPTRNFRACISSAAPDDIDEERTPAFVAAYLRSAFA